MHGYFWLQKAMLRWPRPWMVTSIVCTACGHLLRSHLFQEWLQRCISMHLCNTGSENKLGEPTVIGIFDEVRFSCKSGKIWHFTIMRRNFETNCDLKFRFRKCISYLLPQRFLETFCICEVLQIIHCLSFCLKPSVCMKWSSVFLQLL